MKLYLILKKTPLKAIKLPLSLVRWLVARTEIKAYRRHERIVNTYKDYFVEFPDVHKVLTKMHLEIQGPGRFKNPIDYIDKVTNMWELRKELRENRKTKES